MSKANNIYKNSRAIQSSSTVASSLALSQGDDDLDNLPSDARANTQANAFSEYGICRPANATYPMSLKSFYSEIDEDAHWSNRDHATAAETKAPEHQLLDWKNHPTKKFDTIPGTDTPDLFDRYAIPSQKQLADAAEMYLDGSSLNSFVSINRSELRMAQMRMERRCVLVISSPARRRSSFSSAPPSVAFVNRS